MAAYTYDELVNALEIQKANLPTYLTELGVTPGDLTAIDEELEDLIEARNYGELADTAKRTAFANKAALFNGKNGEAIPDYAPIAQGVLPNPNVKAGCLERFQERNRRYRAAAGYTPEIGIACALVRSSEPTVPGTVKPTAECDPAQSGNMFTIIVKNRGDSTLYDVLGCPVGETQFNILKTTDTRSTDVTVPAKVPPGPQTFQVRVQLKKAGENYGQMSDIVLVTVVP